MIRVGDGYVEAETCGVDLDHSGSFAVAFASASAQYDIRMEVQYLSFALIVCIGLWLEKDRSALKIAAAALAGSVLFFVLTNFGVWAFGSLYPRTLGGLMDCYIAAIPFFRNTLQGDMLYTLILFGGFALLERRFSVLRESSVRSDLSSA